MPNPTPHNAALVFVHVPKTAGSSLKWIIQRQYPAEQTVVIEGEEMQRQFHRFHGMAEAARGRLRCLMGHIPFGVHALLPQGARYITMLRDPVEWTLSFHSFIKRNLFFENHPDFAAFRGVGSMDLEAFLDFLSRSHMNDMQTRLVAGELPPLDVMPPYESLSPEALVAAKQNLHRDFECVGVVERFDESLLVMKRKLGWRKIYYRRLNVGERRAGRKDLPQWSVKRILACNSRDVELYAEACSLLSAQIAAAGAGFRAEVRRFQRINAIYSALLPVYEISGIRRARRALRRAI